MLDCRRPLGTSISENPQWIINGTFIVNTDNSQKYEVNNAVPSLTIKSLSYDDAGHYSCIFSGGNTSADTVAIIGACHIF